MALSGLDIWSRSGFAEIRGKTVGVVCNHAAVDRNLDHLVDLLLAGGVKIAKIFAPEHGFRGALQDMAGVDSQVDPQTKITVVSLYGSTKESLAPQPQQLGGLDAVVCDLPDIGTRYYTFAQTIGLLLETAAPLKTPVFVIDRPNPIDGQTIEGGPLVKECRSFCGYAPVPNRHGLTLGELCSLMNGGFGAGNDTIPPLKADLHIIRVEDWQRSQYLDDTGLPWVFPSPNMPNLDTAIVYPGMCLFEATNISEGRGTTRPFELIGAPFINPPDWIEETRRTGLALSGAKLRPAVFVPKFQKFADTTCHGIQLHITDRAEFKPFRWGLALIAALHRLYPKNFSWRKGSYEFEDKVSAIDLLYGSSRFRETVEADQTLAGLEQEISAFEKSYAAERKNFLLY